MYTAPHCTGNFVHYCMKSFQRLSLCATQQAQGSMQSGGFPSMYPKPQHNSAAINGTHHCSMQFHTNAAKYSRTSSTRVRNRITASSRALRSASSVGTRCQKASLQKDSATTSAVLLMLF
eukprot:TRINITY_DN1105_c0_g1_i2.p1 TRINITY_DN1105_c0_g1~~TRINITY_DN1105_c0_g1_i2.p1  ORF type:complete len:120 (-),score=15.60 TRINITY_DN1105_c0_g1_i2:397-756(-)